MSRDFGFSFDTDPSSPTSSAAAELSSVVVEQPGSTTAGNNGSNTNNSNNGVAAATGNDSNNSAIELTSITINGVAINSSAAPTTATSATPAMPPISPMPQLSSPTSSYQPGAPSPSSSSPTATATAAVVPPPIVRTASVYELPMAPPPAAQSMGASPSLPHQLQLAARPDSAPPEGPAPIPKSQYDTAREAGSAWVAAQISNEHSIHRRAEEAFIYSRQHLWENFWDNLFAEYYRDTIHIRHRDNKAVASHIGLKAYEEGVKYLMNADAAKMKIVDCCMTLLAGPDVYWDGGVEGKPTQVTAEDGRIIEQHRRLVANTAPATNKFGALTITPFPFRATFTFDVTGEQAVFSWLPEVDGIRRDPDEGMLQLKQLIAVNLTTRKVERLRRERRALRAIDQVPINIIPYWGMFRMLKPWSQLIRHPIDGERLDVGAGFDYELQNVKYIEELPATCFLFAARRPPPATLKSSDLAKHLATLVVDTVTEEDLKKVNDRYESWRFYEAKRFDGQRRTLSHSFYPFVYLDATLTQAELQKRVLAMEGPKHALVLDLFAVRGKHRAKLDLMYKRHKMFANSLAAPFWFQTFASMWHALRPFKSELHSANDDIRTCAVADWYLAKDSNGQPFERTPRPVAHPLDPENHTGLCFLPMDRPELEKRLEQLGLWPVVREFLTPAFLQHFYNLIDQLIVTSLQKAEFNKKTADLTNGSGEVGKGEGDAKRAEDTFSSVDKSKNANKKKAAALPDDDNTAHYDDGDDYVNTNKELLSPQIEGRVRDTEGKRSNDTSRSRASRHTPTRPDSFWFRFMSCGPARSDSPPRRHTNTYDDDDHTSTSRRPQPRSSHHGDTKQHSTTSNQPQGTNDEIEEEEEEQQQEGEEEEEEEVEEENDQTGDTGGEDEEVVSPVAASTSYDHEEEEEEQEEEEEEVVAEPIAV